MPKQHYTYTMPEAFVKDPSVPARWRVYGVLNGFFVNNKQCWASNEWIGKAIGAHKDTVSQAVKELELLQLINCERTKASRVINRGIGDNAYPPSVPTPIKDRRQRLTIADSNADSRKKASPSFQVVKDEPEKKNAPRDKAALRLRAKLYDLFADEYGVYPTISSADYYRVLAATKRLDEAAITELVQDGISQGKRTVSECLTDRAITIYLQDNA